MFPMEYYNARHISLFDGILSIELHYCNMEYVLDAWRVKERYRRSFVLRTRASLSHIKVQNSAFNTYYIFTPVNSQGLRCATHLLHPLQF